MSGILIVGDTCPIGRNEPLFRQGDADGLLGDLRPEFEAAGLVIANLECPLIERETPIAKCGPNLGAPLDCVKGLTAMGVDVVGLANNHIMDHGPRGLRSTISALKEQGIDYVGAGDDLAEARRILIRELDGVRVGVLAVAEHEFGMAKKTTPGANPLDIIDAVRNINEHRGEFDYLIVLLHGGNEHYPYPRPSLMATCRFLVEHGAGAVMCQHSHCVGCVESYRGAPIVYGQGNFLFDRLSKAPKWHEGALIFLPASRGPTFGVRRIPYRQSDDRPGARRLTSDQETSFLKEFDSRSKAIRDESFVTRQWEAFCQRNKRRYLHNLHGKPGILRRLAGKLDLLHYLDSANVQRSRLNMIRCDSHREALLTVLAREADGK